MLARLSVVISRIRTTGFEALCARGKGSVTAKGPAPQRALVGPSAAPLFHFGISFPADQKMKSRIFTGGIRHAFGA